MKKLLSLGFCMLAAATASAQTPAFPEAEGFGMYATGGRGGKVYYVTRNDDCTDNNLVEGTLRWALRSGDDTPRTILFKTCGTIYLTSQLKFSHPNVTIAGQTAPGGGICIAGYKIYVCKPNVILRHLRFRAGDLAAKSMPSLDVENTSNVIIDHCSLTWSMEECLTMYDCDSTTVQYCIIGESLYNSRNAKGARAYATQWGGEHSTMHHCLITNSNSRSPRFNGVRDNSKNPGDHDQFVDSEFFNNVVFNWGKSNSLYGGECDPTINEGNSYNRVYMKGNYFRPGPTTKACVTKNRYIVEASNKNKGMGQWLLEGNKFELSSAFAPSTNTWTDAVLKKIAADNYYGISSSDAGRTVNVTNGTAANFLSNNVLKEQDVKSGLAVETADEAYAKVVAQAGASMPRYDEVDRRLLDEAAGTLEPQYCGRDDNGNPSRGLGIIDSQKDVQLAEHDTFQGIYEAADGTKTEVTVTDWPFLGLRDGEKFVEDTDADGLPDAYEKEVGLDATNPADGAVIGADGYSNLERYLNGVANGTIDKSKYETVDVSSISSVNASSSEAVSCYNLKGEKSTKLFKGLNIVKHNTGEVHKVIRKH